MEIFIDQDDFVNKMETFNYSGKDNDKYVNKHENKSIRKSVGQLAWAATQTRPDIAFDALNLSMYLNKATLCHAKDANKAVKKAKATSVKIKFSHLGDWKKLHLEVFADAALGNAEKDLQTKSVMGYFVGLANDNLDVSPLHCTTV